jgi:hypothetical protein
MENIINQIDISDVRICITKLTEELNLEYFKGKENYQTEKPSNLKEWEILFIQAGYIEYFDDPVELLMDLMSLSKTKFDYIFKNAKPIILARIVNFKSNIDLNSEEIKDLIQNKKELISFVGTLIFSSYGNSLLNTEQIDNSIYETIIFDNLDICGWDILKRLFGIDRRAQNVKLEIIKEKVLEIFINRYFINTGNENQLAINSAYPERLTTLCNIFHKIKDYEAMNNPFYELLTKSFIKYLNNISNNLHKIVYGERYLYNYKFEDVINERTQITFSYILISILKCDKESYDAFIKTFRNYCYDLKPIFYGEYTAQYTAKSFTETILLILFSVVNIRNIKLSHDDIKRLKYISDMINNILLFPYIRISEREYIIWDPDDYKPTMMTKEIYLINEYAKLLISTSELSEIFLKIFNRWRDISLTKWPWMR